MTSVHAHPVEAAESLAIINGAEAVVGHSVGVRIAAGAGAAAMFGAAALPPAVSRPYIRPDVAQRFPGQPELARQVSEAIDQQEASCDMSGSPLAGYLPNGGLPGGGSDAEADEPLSRQELGDLAETAWRELMGQQGIILEPKTGTYAGGPDAVRLGGTDPRWNFAELKLKTKWQKKKGSRQVRRRLREGYPGPGALYLWEYTPEGGFTFTRHKIW